MKTDRNGAIESWNCMRNKPVLVVMAAGLGSRYGGLKQVAPVDDVGHTIIDYSIYDAYRAGFRDVICVIKPGVEKEFGEHFKDFSLGVNIRYAYQVMDNLPTGFSVPLDRQKPWGTAHAVLSAKDHVNGPFAVINADDFYGYDAFRMIYNFLENEASATRHAMVGYRIENTLTESGSVARGVCNTNGNRLLGIQEITEIKPAQGGAIYSNGSESVHLPDGTMVSMNMWGFGYEMLNEIENRFESFLINSLTNNPLKCEYFLPSVVSELLEEKKSVIEILPTTDKWHGVTYADDMPGVRFAIEQMKQSKIYPNRLWEGKHDSE